MLIPLEQVSALLPGNKDPGLIFVELFLEKLKTI